LNPLSKDALMPIILERVCACLSCFPGLVQNISMKQKL
jgi:hypothetical protein